MSKLMDPNIEDRNMNAEKELGWGKSLPVPSVQEMVKNDSEGVPERYIKEYQDWPIDSTFSPNMFDNIPVINFALLVSGDGDELNKLDSACKEWGFFQLINHGVEVEVLSNMKAAVAAFFYLPLEDKKNYAMAENDIQGYGQVHVVSEHQKLDWCDMSFLITQPPEYRNFKFWPTTLPGFKEAVDEYSKEVEKVSVEICECLSRLMGLDKHGLKRLHGVMKQSMRLNYYPRCSRPDLVLGVSPHSDGGSITFLLQDDEITALQIKYKERWLPVKPIPNALVVNVGDALEAWSNGVYRSIEHRAVTNTKKERISIATFVLPDEGAQIGPVESMMVDRPRLYRNVKFLDYLKQLLDKKLDGKSHTSFLKLEKEL
ncbi:S-norcoclaurine synthase 1 [Ziziphus jujuba]|uniref:S-norcoclaurine synthase 1 n=1 Tax=Ziziphus jujuba TaxID=326968 RepID=A0ABM3IDJ9_ZIZJJ|nr:S-norcoclaurine synthase 1 [Ziziphus jujuba]